MVFSLTALLLHLRKKGGQILWHGELRDIPLPAAICGNSPWIDITQSATMWEGEKQAPFDYLPRPGAMDWHKLPPCPAWPTTPFRQRLYIDDDLAAHPLATLPMYDSWAGCPPVYICAGWEILSLEARWFARQLANDGVTVLFEEYEAMPHAFALMLSSTRNAAMCYDVWSGFIKQAVEDPKGIEGKARRISARTLDVEEVEFEKLCDVGVENMRERIRAFASNEEVVAKL